MAIFADRTEQWRIIRVTIVMSEDDSRNTLLGRAACLAEECDELSEVCQKLEWWSGKRRMLYRIELQTLIYGQPTPELPGEGVHTGTAGYDYVVHLRSAAEEYMDFMPPAPQIIREVESAPDLELDDEWPERVWELHMSDGKTVEPFLNIWGIPENRTWQRFMSGPEGPRLTALMGTLWKGRTIRKVQDSIEDRADRRLRMIEWRDLCC